MKKANLILICLIILAGAAVTMSIVSQMRLKQQDTMMEEKIAEYSKQQDIMMQTQLEMQRDRDERDKLALQAREAQRMAEAQAEKERLEREKIVAELNARLQRESEDRFKAEKAQAELAAKMEALQATQAETQKALAALEQAKAEVVAVVDVEAQQQALALKEKIDQQSQRMESLLEENKALKEQHDKLVESQMSTAQAIVGMGGTIEKNTFVDVFLESMEDLVKGAPHFWGYDPESKKP